MKIDAVPGITTHYRVTPTEARCARRSSAPSSAASGTPTCARPRTSCPGEDFAAWVRRASRAGAGGRAGRRPGRPSRPPAGPPTPGQADLHERRHQTNATACGGCHTLADAGTNGQAGPNLDKVLKGKDAAFIEQSIVDPERRDRARLQQGHHAPELQGHAVGGAGQGARRLPREGDEVMAARMRAPGWYRAALWTGHRRSRSPTG